MQSMAAAFGASIVRAPTLVHGEASEVTHDGPGLLEGMPPSFMAARYHSLAVDPATLPPELRVTAMSEVDRVVMGIRHVRCRSRASSSTRVRAHAAGPAPARELPAPGRRGRGVPARRATARSRRRDGRGDEPAPGTRPTCRRSPMSDAVGALAAVVDGRTLTMDEARARWPP
jgi:hypothetical protein